MKTLFLKVQCSTVKPVYKGASETT